MFIIFIDTDREKLMENEVITTSFVKRLVKEIEELKKTNVELRDTINKVREYIDKEHKLLYLDKKGYTYTKIGKDILEILDKGEQNVRLSSNE